MRNLGSIRARRKEEKRWANIHTTRAKTTNRESHQLGTPLSQEPNHAGSEHSRDHTEKKKKKTEHRQVLGGNKNKMREKGAIQKDVSRPIMCLRGGSTKKEDNRGRNKRQKHEGAKTSGAGRFSARKNKSNPRKDTPSRCPNSDKNSQPRSH